MEVKVLMAVPWVPGESQTASDGSTERFNNSLRLKCLRSRLYQKTLCGTVMSVDADGGSSGNWF